MSQPVEVELELDGWALLFARLERVDGGERELESLRRQTVDRTRRRFADLPLTEDPTVAALRRLFRAAGCDPTRYRPSSEALLRRVLRGSALPAIDPFVDLNNCLSLELAAPCCVMAEKAVAPPYRLRRGRAGESYESLKGPFNLQDKPLLEDLRGPCDAPITGSERVKIHSDTLSAWLVAYLPADTLTSATAFETLRRLVDEGVGVRLLGGCDRPAEAEQAHHDEDR